MYLVAGIIINVSTSDLCTSVNIFPAPKLTLIMPATKNICGVRGTEFSQASSGSHTCLPTISGLGLKER